MRSGRPWAAPIVFAREEAQAAYFKSISVRLQFSSFSFNGAEPAKRLFADGDNKTAFQIPIFAGGLSAAVDDLRER